MAYSYHAFFIVKFFLLFTKLQKKYAKFKQALSKKKNKLRPYEQIIHIPSKYIKHTKEDIFKMMHLTESGTKILIQNFTDLKDFKKPASQVLAHSRIWSIASKKSDMFYVTHAQLYQNSVHFSVINCMIIQKTPHWSQACRIDKGIVDRNECFCSCNIHLKLHTESSTLERLKNETGKSAEVLRQTGNPKNSTPRVFPFISKRKAHQVPCFVSVGLAYDKTCSFKIANVVFTISELEPLCNFIAFSCTFPITASAQRARDIRITPIKTNRQTKTSSEYSPAKRWQKV